MLFFIFEIRVDHNLNFCSSSVYLDLLLLLVNFCSSLFFLVIRVEGCCILDHYLGIRTSWDVEWIPFEYLSAIPSLIMISMKSKKVEYMKSCLAFAKK